MTSSDEHPAGFDHRPGFPMSFRPAGGRVRVIFAGTVVADTAHAMVMQETGHEPVYYFAPDAVRMDLLIPTAHASH